MKSLFRNLMVTLLWKGAKRRFAIEKPTIIAITGSIGKTSAKEAIALVLAASGRAVIKTAGNLNTDLGVPLSLLGFTEQPAGLADWLEAILRAWWPPRLARNSHPYYVLEYSTDKPGDMPFLASQLPLDVAILTTIAPAHMANFPVFEDLVQEKLSLLTGLKDTGYAILNADDVKQEDTAHSVCWYGLGERQSGKEMVLGSHVSMGEKGLTYTIDYSATKRMDTIGRKQPHSLRVQTQVIGRQHLMPLLAAAAIGFKEGVDPEKIKKALEGYVLPNGRGRLIEGRKDIVIIDDSYNASPEAVKAGLDMLKPFAKKRRTVAILGRMNELGDITLAAHQEIGKYAADKVDFLVGVGEYASQVVKAAHKAGLPEIQCLTFDTTQHLIDKLDQVVQREDVVYIKGSQNGVRLEQAVKALMLHPGQASQLLVRQEHHWK